MSQPVVSIIGRPNVGKSSLFNRMLQRKLAVVDAEAGVTRDRNYATCDWAGRSFMLVDTGGIVPDSSDLMESLITDQTDFAIHESDLIILVVDSHTGFDSTELKIAKSVRKSGKKCLLVANKSDSERFEMELYDFLKLGLGEPIPVSATVGRGIGEFLDLLVEALPEFEEETDDGDQPIRIALVGKPNVGKSSFINKLIGQERLIVSPIAGTTRDSVDTPFEYKGQKYNLIDTAGLRRKYKVTENIEFYTNLRTDRALDSCDVAIILFDATEEVSQQDQKILEKVTTMRRPAIIAVNKWDLIEKDGLTADRFTREIKDVILKYSYLPLIFISALTGQRIEKVIDMAYNVYLENKKRISTPELNSFLEKTVARKHPPARKGKYIKFNYLTQSEIQPPTFIFFSNFPDLIEKSYISFLANQLRATYGFEGVSIRLKFRRK